MTRTLLFSWSGSLAVHVLALALVVWLFRGERIESVLFIDLTEPVRVEPNPRPPVHRDEASRAPRPAARSAARAPSPAPRETKTDERGDASRPVETPIAPLPTPSEAPVNRETAASMPIAPREPQPATATTSPEAGRATAREEVGRAPIGGNVAAAEGSGVSGTGGGRATADTAGGRGAGGGDERIARGMPGAGEGQDLGPYHKAIWQHVRDALEYPAVVRRRGLKGTVEVDISFGSDGAVRDVTLARSSSNGTLDRAAIDALRQLPPLPFPPGFPPRALRVRVPVEFDLR